MSDNKEITNNNETVDIGDKQKKRRQRDQYYYDLFKYIIIIVLACLFIIILTNKYICISFVPSESMENTLKIGDVVIGSRQFDEIERYDIVVFNPPKSLGTKKKFVKRVIGLPGDTIEVINHKLYINGELSDDSFAKEEMLLLKSKWVLGEDEYFVVGDNRNNSYDSRYWSDPFIHKSDIIAVNKVIIYPLNRSGDITYKNN